MATILKGAPVAAKICEDLTERIAVLKKKNITPTLALVRIGNRPDDLSYRGSIIKKAEAYGIVVRDAVLPAGGSSGELYGLISSLNSDPDVHGIMLLRPFPPKYDEIEACNTISPEKDVDGCTTFSLGSLFSGENAGFAPCTACAVIRLLEFYGIETEGRQAVVLGRSKVVGRPAAMMLLSKNATVTLCHSRTENESTITRNADILVSAVGIPGLVTADFIREGAVVVDVGMNYIEASGTFTGDADYDGVSKKASAVTPVPGGIGSITTSILLDHVVQAAERRNI